MKRHAPIRRKTPLNLVGHSETTQLKQAIQAELRRIVIKGDGGCVLRDFHYHDFPECNGYTKAGVLILQAEHLIERSNSATFADPHLVVCICKGHHKWKHSTNANKAQYDAAVRTLLSEERVKLWDACEKDSWRPKPPL